MDSPYHAPSKPSSNEQSTPTAERKGSEKKRRVKMADLRTLIETRILSKSDRGLEKIGLDAAANGKRLQHLVRIPYVRESNSILVFIIHRNVIAAWILGKNNCPDLPQ